MEILFILLVIALALGTLMFVHQAFGSLGPILVGVVLAGWLTTLAVLANRGFFQDFSSIPPHIALAILPNILIMLALALVPNFDSTLLRAKPSSLVAFQSFRIVMEFILYRLITQQRLPGIMTFTGRNYDIIVGLTAPLVAWFCFKNERERYSLIKFWNVAGFLILVNTVLHGLLAAPTPFQVFFTNPSNTLIAEFPWIWLPGFVVPIALMGHIVSFRQVSALQKKSSAQDYSG